MTRVAILGTEGPGAQIACDYALGGCSVVWVDEDRDGAERRIGDSLRLAAQHVIAGPAELERARALLEPREGPPGSEGRLTLIVESLPDQLELKAAQLSELAGHHPEALLAATGATISPTTLGEAAEVGERMLCAHYLDAPLLTPMVELLAARETPPRLLQRLAQLLKAIGKRPVILGREVPGLAAERLRLALLREGMWLVARGVASPEQVDELVRDGLARAWRHVGPLGEAAIAGPERVEAAAAVVFPSLAAEQGAEGLRGVLGTEHAPRGEHDRRDAALAAELRAERSAAGEARG